MTTSNRAFPTVKAVGRCNRTRVCRPGTFRLFDEHRRLFVAKGRRASDAPGQPSTPAREALCFLLCQELGISTPQAVVVDPHPLWTSEPSRVDVLPDEPLFGSEVVVVVSKDENLTKSHGRYLESRLIGLIGSAERARLANGTAPAPPPLPEPDIADMEAFLRHIELIMPVLGFPFLQPQPSVSQPSINAHSSPLLALDRVQVNATAREVDGEFIVLKGSTARRQGVDSWTSYVGLRQQLIDDGKLRNSSDPDFFEFTSDVSFSSPSAAAAVIMARNANGRKEWKLADSGMSYRDWQDAQLVGVEGDEA